MNEHEQPTAETSAAQVNTGPTPAGESAGGPPADTPIYPTADGHAQRASGPMAWAPPQAPNGQPPAGMPHAGPTAAPHGGAEPPRMPPPPANGNGHAGHTAGQPGWAPPTAYAQPKQSAGYGPPVYGPPPVPVPEPTRRPGGHRGLVVALAIAIAALLLGGAAAVIVIVSGSDKPAHAAAAAPAAATSAPSRTVTIIERQSSSSSSGSTSSASSHSTKRTASHHPQVVEPAASSASSSSSSSSRTLARAEIKSMLGRHFANIRDGNFSSAFADLGASLGQSESAWTSDLRADGLYSFDLTVEPQLTSSTSGVANIVAFHTEADASGCKDWSGSWDVAKSGGRWLITKSNLSQTTVSCGE